MNIDREIAEKVMGWSDDLINFMGEWRDRHSDSTGYDVDDWHPSMNIAQAFEVVEKMRGKGFEFEFESGGDKAEYHAVFTGGGMSLGIAEHDNPAMAICKTALKAMVNITLCGGCTRLWKHDRRPDTPRWLRNMRW